MFHEALLSPIELHMSSWQAIGFPSAVLPGGALSGTPSIVEVVYVDLIIFDIHRVLHVAAHFWWLFEDSSLSYVHCRSWGEEGIDGQSVGGLSVFLELGHFLLAHTIVINDNLPILAFLASLSPLVMVVLFCRIFRSCVIAHEQRVVGAPEFSRVRPRHNVPDRRLSFKSLINPIVHADSIVMLALLHIWSLDIDAPLFLIDARSLMCHEAVLAGLRSISSLIPALYDKTLPPTAM